MSLQDFGAVVRLLVATLIFTYVAVDIVGDWLAARAIKKLEDYEGE